MTHRTFLSVCSSALSFSLALGLAGCSLDRTELGGGTPGVDASGVDGGDLDAGDAEIALDAGDAEIPVDGGRDGGPCGTCEAPMICCGTTCLDPTSDVLHCGGCDACVSGARSTATCVASTCGLVCEAGWADCDGDAANGCERDLTDVATCGSCAVSCPSGPGSTPVCTATGCEITCDPALADCDGNATNGCEAALSSITSCGACGVVCPAPASASATCDATGCGFTCDLGFEDCDGNATNGCEASLTSITSCLACGVVCDVPASASATCDATGCGFACDAGFEDCDGSAANGCEAELATSATHCGACGVMCAPGRSCAAGRCVGWTALATMGGPTARWDHSAVWTGTEMIVWGGQLGGSVRSDGAAYAPATGTWRTISNSGAPSARRGHTAEWTGTEMIIWGGYSGSFLDTGAAYDPATDTWRTITTSGGPSTRSRVPPVWSGSELIVWGGWGGTSGARDTGARWSASGNAWTDITTTGAPSSRRWHAAVWTGSRMVLFGGESGGGTLRTDGFSYDPGGNAWSAITTTGAPAGRARAVYVWTDGLATPSMIVWGGDGGSSGGDPASSVRADGARYDPVANAWTAMSAAPIAGRSMATAVWTGTEMIVWGGDGASSVLGDGAAYAPGANTWRAIPASGSPTARTRHTAVWTGSEMIVFGGMDGSGGSLAAGARLSL